MENNNAKEFNAYIDEALAVGFLKEGDVLVLDNASYHSGACCSDLENFLWSYNQILLIFLPARTPEWNPVELLWNILRVRLNTEDLTVLHQYNKHSVARCAAGVMDEFTFDLVDKCYEHCFKLEDV